MTHSNVLRQRQEMAEIVSNKVGKSLDAIIVFDSPLDKPLIKPAVTSSS